jgi:hypothetical protein
MFALNFLLESAMHEYEYGFKSPELAFLYTRFSTTNPYHFKT